MKDGLYNTENPGSVAPLPNRATRLPAAAMMRLWQMATPVVRKSKRGLVTAAAAVIILLVVTWLSGVLQNAVIAVTLHTATAVPDESASLRKARQQLERDIAGLDKKLGAKVPRSFYLVINTASNEFSLYRRDVLVKKDKCSTGSYVLLKNGDTQQWMFKTPKGKFSIQGKTTAPVWHKPDWAFVEDGLPVPPANHHSRYERGVLGDYALSLGHGYLIHGTLYQRFLGLPVTHGCVRLNDENLELVFRSMPVGGSVYIF